MGSYRKRRFSTCKIQIKKEISKDETKSNNTNLPEEQTKNTSQLKQLTQAASFSGPIPPPSALAGYEKVLPGSADRIIKMAESEALHRRELEKTELNVYKTETFRGQKFALTIGIVGIVASAIVACFGSPIAGCTIGVATIGALVSSFIIGRKSKD